MRLSEHAANVEADAGAALMDNGFLRMFDAQDTLLAECRFFAPAFAMATCGQAKAYRILPDPDAKAQGRPVVYRTYMADGQTLVQEGTVGPPKRLASDPSYDMELPTPLIVPHAEFHVTEFWYRRRRQ